VQPWRVETFKLSTDPELEGKIPDVVGLYLHPPEKAVVLCVDEKPQIQALERTAAALPTRPGFPELQTFDYVRHGTTTLFAALEVGTGKVTDACTDRHRHQEFLGFLKQVAAYPRRQLHVVVDNYATAGAAARRGGDADPPANLEGAGEIPLRRLVKEALRMRPSRIVVGEVRQEECLDLTQDA
jgi:hypothetical protein